MAGLASGDATPARRRRAVNGGRGRADIVTGVPTPPAEQTATPLAPLTTLRLGGPARRLVEVDSEQELIAAVRELDAAGEPLLVLAGGSNVVIADDGFDGTVVLVRTRGIERAGDEL